MWWSDLLFFAIMSFMSFGDYSLQYIFFLFIVKIYYKKKSFPLRSIFSFLYFVKIYTHFLWLVCGEQLINFDFLPTDLLSSFKRDEEVDVCEIYFLGILFVCWLQKKTLQVSSIWGRAYFRANVSQFFLKFSRRF